MTEINVISTAGIAPPSHPPDGGSPPQLRWIAIDDLYVDSRYQRELGRHNRAAIARVAAGFDWSFFAPVIVAPLEGGDFFCIIDGQHRTTAAKLIGKTSVPCSVVIASYAKQAAAFSAINGTVTRVHTLQMHRSAVAAGDRKALEIEQVAREGKTTILGSPRSARDIKPGETLAVAALANCIARFGRESVIRTLLILNDGLRPYRCMIYREMLEGILLALPKDAARQDVLDQFASINLGAVEEEARKALAERKGRLSLHICDALVIRLRARAA